jgi:heme A synthase
MTKLARFSWGVLVYNLAVIAWGVYVRATRSGAGCGAHWPLCNGEVVPQSPSVEMLVEFSHRVSSGLALVAVAALLIWVWRVSAPGHPARRTAAWSMVFMLTEAGLGAALVLFRLVADNASTARAWFMAAHLTNTLLLLACLAWTAYHLSRAQPAGVPPPSLARLRRAAVVRFGLGGLVILLAAVSGAIAALGDTLYPAGSLAEALGTEFSAASHLLVRLRLLHPSIAVIMAVALVITGIRVGYETSGWSRRLGFALAGVVVWQVLVGLTSVLLLAPVWMQMVHVVSADLVWIAFVLLALERSSATA